MKTCTKCHQEKPLGRFSRRKYRDELRCYCKDCANKWDRERLARMSPSERRLRNRRKNLSRFYQITPEEYDRLLKGQGGCCAVCGRNNPGGRWNIFAIDHDHLTGRIRGLLCTSCNTAIGLLDDSPVTARAVASYLEAR